MDDVVAFKTIGLLALNFLFSFAVSNYLSQEIDLVKSPITSLKIFCAAYCLGYFVLIIITARSLVPPQVQRFKGRSVVISVLKWFIGVVIFHCLAVLYGASLSRYVEETFMWSVMMSDLVVLPCLLVDTEDIMKAVVTRQRNINLAWCLCNIVVTLTVAGAWVGAFTLPLDWDRDWQVWPIPCAAGAMIGHLLSFVISGFLLYWKYRNKDKNKFI